MRGRAGARPATALRGGLRALAGVGSYISSWGLPRANGEATSAAKRGADPSRRAAGQ